MINIGKERFDEIFKKAKGSKIAVIGDVMIDKYFWGDVNRISPEAPVPVVDFEREDIHLGGAANTAANLFSLGLEPLLFALVGKDEMGEKFMQVSKDSNIDTSGIFADKNRMTTVKTRIFGNNQQLLRLDNENNISISDEGQEHILNSLENQNDLSALLFADYDKGVLSPSLIRKVIKYCKKKNIPVLVDPKKENFFAYKGVAMFKPNKKEAEDALGFELNNNASVEGAGLLLLEKLDCENVLLTLGASGMVLFERGREVCKIDTKARHVADVSGAGDTAIATYAAVIAGGGTHPQAMGIANSASGIVCEEPGIVTIELGKLSEYFL